MAFGSTIPALAKKLINKFGVPMVYTRRTVGAYNPATSSAAMTTADYSISGVIEEFPDTLRMLGQQLKEGDAVADTDRKITIAGDALGFTPSIGDTITVGTSAYAVDGVGIQYAGAFVGYYDLKVRKA